SGPALFFKWRFGADVAVCAAGAWLGAVVGAAFGAFLHVSFLLAIARDPPSAVSFPGVGTWGGFVVGWGAGSLLGALVSRRRKTGVPHAVQEADVGGIRKVLLLQGARRFGQPGASVKAAIEAITDPNQLEQLSLRLLEVDSWQELLG